MASAIQEYPSWSVLQEDNVIPTKWPLARVIAAHPGRDELTRVVTAFW